jgi:hypothetical protein
LRRLLVSSLVLIGLAAGLFMVPPAAAQAAFAIEPGKVFVDNMYPGGVAEFPITIYNDTDAEATYVIKARAPDYTDPEYETLPYLEWIRVTPGNITISAGGQANVKVTITVPKDAVYPSKKAEAWVSFMQQVPEEQGGGTIQIELAARILISTTDEVPSGSQPTVTETPAIISENNGAVGIKAEGNADAAKSAGKGFSSWGIVGAAIGVIAAGGLIYFLTRRPKKA